MCDEKLKDLLQLRELQDQVIALRTEAPPMYGKYLKEEAGILMKNLMHSEVIVEMKPIEKPKMVDFNVEEYKIEPEISLPHLNQRTDNLMKCLKYYKE